MDHNINQVFQQLKNIANQNDQNNSSISDFIFKQFDIQVDEQTLCQKSNDKPEITNSTFVPPKAREKESPRKRSPSPQTQFDIEFEAASKANFESPKHPKIHICEIPTCRKQFNNRSNMVRHMKHAHGNEEIFCNLCHEKDKSKL